MSGMGRRVIKGVGQHLAEDHVKSTMQGRQSLASKMVQGTKPTPTPKPPMQPMRVKPTPQPLNIKPTAPKVANLNTPMPPKVAITPITPQKPMSATLPTPRPTQRPNQRNDE
jgi:hypothetical protein